MKLTMTILGVAILAWVIAILNVHVVDYDAESKAFSYQPRLIEFGFDFSTMTIKADQAANPLFIATITLGLTALLLSPVAYFKEKEGPVCLIVGGIGVVAVLWQLIVLIAIVGIVIGIALSIFLSAS